MALSRPSDRQYSLFTQSKILTLKKFLHPKVQCTLQSLVSFVHVRFRSLQLSKVYEDFGKTFIKVVCQFAEKRCDVCVCGVCAYARHFPIRCVVVVVGIDVAVYVSFLCVVVVCQPENHCMCLSFGKQIKHSLDLG